MTTTTNDDLFVESKVSLSTENSIQTVVATLYTEFHYPALITLVENLAKLALLVAPYRVSLGNTPPGRESRNGYHNDRLRWPWIGYSISPWILLSLNNASKRGSKSQISSHGLLTICVVSYPNARKTTIRSAKSKLEESTSMPTMLIRVTLLPGIRLGVEVFLVRANICMPGVRRLVRVRVFRLDIFPVLILHHEITVERLSGNGTA